MVQFWSGDGTLAPMALNQQKFEIALNEDGSVEFIDKGGVFSKVDLGIVKYHFEVGADYVKSQGMSNPADIKTI